MKVRCLFLALVVSSSASGGFAAEPFAQYFGAYRVTGCESSANGYVRPNDPECDYDQVSIVLERPGVVRVTRLTSDGNSIGVPLSAYSLSESGFVDEAKFHSFGPHHEVWRRSLAYPVRPGSDRELELTTYALNTDASGKITLLIGASSHRTSGARDSSEYRLTLVRAPVR